MRVKCLTVMRFSVKIEQHRRWRDKAMSSGVGRGGGGRGSLKVSSGVEGGECRWVNLWKPDVSIPLPLSPGLFVGLGSE